MPTTGSKIARLRVVKPLVHLRERAEEHEHDGERQQNTVSRSDVRVLISRSASVRIICRLDEFYEGVLLLRDDGFVAHQFIKPRLAVLRDDRADEPRGFAGFGVCAGEIHQRRLAARHDPAIASICGKSFLPPRPDQVVRASDSRSPAGRRLHHPARPRSLRRSRRSRRKWKIQPEEIATAATIASRMELSKWNRHFDFRFGGRERRPFATAHFPRTKWILKIGEFVFCGVTTVSSPVILKNQLIVPRVSIATKIRWRALFQSSVARSRIQTTGLLRADGDRLGLVDGVRVGRGGQLHLRTPHVDQFQIAPDDG
jgi:hypothetical protein